MHLFSDFADSDRRATPKKERKRENAMIRHLRNSDVCLWPITSFRCRAVSKGFRGKPDIEWQAGSAGSVENDPTATATA